MDSKNDDSAGSDSLDKSLQKKCVVDDVGQGEGPLALAHGSASDNSGKKSAGSETDAQPENSTKNQKTENSMGDGGGSIDSEGGVRNVQEIAESANKEKAQNMSDENSACATLATDTTENIPNSTALTAATTSSSTATPSNSNSNAFETKVKQISKNLKETTLAESANNIKKTSLEDSNSTSSTSSSSTSTPESEQVAPPLSLASGLCSDPNATTSSGQTVDLDSNQLSVSDSIDEHDHRSKKVRFHPDVKENDGGNRVIPKKKKKLKASAGGDEAATSSQRTGSAEDDMELDEEEEEAEEEEDFDLAKTIAEAQDYLKTHPLTFVRPYDKNSAPLQNGLLEEEDLSQLSESSEEEDIYENVQPENGIQRILGKQVKCGKVEFLLRYSDRPGLGWESEDIITKQCPNLLNKYEQHREQRQEHLMRHVAKRQNIRQRYTDF